MSYLLFLFAFLTTIAGIYGDTWKDNRPTKSGLVILVLALAIFVISIQKHYASQQDVRKIVSTACSKALRATHGVLFPFVAIYADVINLSHKESKLSSHEAQKIHNRIGEFLSLPQENLIPSALTNMLNELTELNDHNDFLRKITLKDYAVVLDNNKSQWSQIFLRTSLKGIKDLDDTLSSFSFIMTPEIIRAIDSFRKTWLVKRLENLNQIENTTTTSLSDFLHLDGRQRQSKNTMLENFIGTAREVVKVCGVNVKSDV